MGLNTSLQSSDAALWDELRTSKDLPSPPGIAATLVSLASREDTEFDQVEELVKFDTAISAKLLRLANSSFYSRGRKIENLRQAIGLFGLNGTLVIALTFSLVKVPKSKKNGLDLNEFWLRSIASGIICKRLSVLCSAGAKDSFYLAGFLQDIGVLALNAIRPGLYNFNSGVSVDHQMLIDAEIAALGIDHSTVGAWLLEQWQFPPLYVDATSTSHATDIKSPNSEFPMLTTCVAVSSYLGQLWSAPTAKLPEALGPIITDHLQLDDATIHALLNDTQNEINEISQLFGVTEVEDSAIRTILSEAKECITLRSLLTEQQLANANSQLHALQKENVKLEHKLDYDELTGVHTRAYAYQHLDNEFSKTSQQASPLSLVFVDLDNFKSINDRFGHGTGDHVLKFASQTLKRTLREQDTIARIGGEEFMILMPDTGFVNASALCERLVKELSRRSTLSSDGTEINVTASIGLSVHGEEQHFPDMHGLIESADAACYQAKNQGKNRWLYR